MYPNLCINISILTVVVVDVTAKNTVHSTKCRPAKNIFSIRRNAPQLPAANVAVLVLHRVLFHGIRKTARAHENLQLASISFYLTYILEVLHSFSLWKQCTAFSCSRTTYICIASISVISKRKIWGNSFLFRVIVAFMSYRLLEWYLHTLDIW